MYKVTYNPNDDYPEYQLEWITSNNSTLKVGYFYIEEDAELVAKFFNKYRKMSDIEIENFWEI